VSAERICERIFKDISPNALLILPEEIKKLAGEVSFIMMKQLI